MFDGQYARRFGMTSPFGDVYDHTSDVAYYIALICTLIIQYRQKMHMTHIAIHLIMLFLLMMALGCMQENSNPQTKKNSAHIASGGGAIISSWESLDHLRGICGSADWIPFIRWFGPGTLVLGNIIIIVHILLRKER